ncbi:flagellar biosynthesis protein FlhB [Aestuariibius insulae]|uniref:EscU/YscU/HrcU family type III secretion system export apparatus switch protein n=1 Tax=Aestuariibius insulae TaxID=2058287 RepID=UPI00345E8095
MSDEASEKEHEPSQKKLDDARKKGEIPRSTDLTTAAAYGGFLLAAGTLGATSLQSLGTTLSIPLDQAVEMSDLVFSESGTPLVGGLLAKTTLYTLPWIGLAAGLSLLVIIAQLSFVVAPTKLAPKMSRLSFIQNAKNKFGRTGLFEFAKSAAKLIIFSVALGIFLTSERMPILHSPSMEPASIMSLLGRMIIAFLMIVLVVATSIGALDFFFQRAEHLRKNRMSRKELMDENKSSDGDPAMKQRRRQKAYDIATNQMLADVPTADVVLVNPTHYAVALVWSRAAGTAPVCVAKGSDEIALRIREIAMTHGIPLRHDPPTARALFGSVQVGQQISTDHYRAVAAAIRFADRLKRKRLK